MRITYTILVPVTVSLNHKGDVTWSEMPSRAVIERRIAATIPQEKRAADYVEARRSRLDEGLVRVVNRDNLVYVAFERATKQHLILVGGVKYRRRNGHLVVGDTWSATALHHEDLAALNAKYPV